MKLWSFDVRSGGPSQTILLEEIRASVGGSIIMREVSLTSPAGFAPRPL